MATTEIVLGATTEIALGDCSWGDHKDRSWGDQKDRSPGDQGSEIAKVISESHCSSSTIVEVLLGHPGLGASLRESLARYGCKCCGEQVRRFNSETESMELLIHCKVDQVLFKVKSDLFKLSLSEAPSSG